MKKTRHTEEQIAFALKQAERGTPGAEVIRRGRLDPKRTLHSAHAGRLVVA